MALYVTLKQVNFFHRFFHDATLKTQFEPWKGVVNDNWIVCVFRIVCLGYNVAIGY